MNSRLGPRTTRDAAGQPGADRDVAVAGQQRGDQRQQRVQVGGQVDVHVGDHPRRRWPTRRAAARGRGPSRRGARRATPGSSRPARWRRPGAVGAGVVGDRDRGREREVRRQVRRAGGARSARGRAPRCRPGRRSRRRSAGRRSGWRDPHHGSTTGSVAMSCRHDAAGRVRTVSRRRQDRPKGRCEPARRPRPPCVDRPVRAGVTVPVRAWRDRARSGPAQPEQ